MSESQPKNTANPSSALDALTSDLTRAKAQELLNKLTQRETEAMVSLAHFRSHKEVAREMGVGPSRIGQYLTSVKQKMKVPKPKDAITVFIIARSLCKLPVYKNHYLQDAALLIDKTVADQSVQKVFETIQKPEFRQWLKDLDSRGPWALSARFGPWWMILSGVVLAILIASAVGISFMVKNQMDQAYASEPPKHEGDEANVERNTSDGRGSEQRAA